MKPLVQQLQAIVGSSYVSTDPDILRTRAVDYTGRYHGQASALVRPGTAEEVAAVLRTCRDVGAYVTVQGGRTSLVAGTVPEHGDVLLSTERLTTIGAVDTTEGRIHVGAGVTLADLQHAAAKAGLLFGVDLSARGSATVGGMASTNAGGLRTVRYGNMREQVVGIEIAMPDGSIVQRYSNVRSDNTGYDLPGLFVGAEGTLGVITELALRLHPSPTYRATALCGFTELGALVDASLIFRDADGIAALELIDGRGAALAAEKLHTPVPLRADWLLLVELAGDTDPNGWLATALDRATLADEPAVGLDTAAQQRLWRVREALAEVVGLFGPPLKFDISLPIGSIAAFDKEATTLAKRHAPEAIPIFFGHIGEGNLHLNVLRCNPDQEEDLYCDMLELIAAHAGNVSSEHGVGTRKRRYLGMSRQPADIAAMRVIKSAFDPTGYLNSAVLFD